MTTGQTISLAILESQIVEFRALHPHLNVELLVTGYIVDMHADKIDQAIRPQAIHEECPGTEVIPLCDVGFAVYGSKNYLAKHGAPDSFDDIADHALVSHDKNALQYFSPLNWAAENLHPKTVPLTTNQVGVMIHAASQDLGLAVLPCFVSEKDDSLVRVIDETDELTLKLAIYVRDDIADKTDAYTFV